MRGLPPPIDTPLHKCGGCLLYKLQVCIAVKHIGQRRRIVVSVLVDLAPCLLENGAYIRRPILHLLVQQFIKIDRETGGDLVIDWKQRADISAGAFAQHGRTPAVDEIAGKPGLSYIAGVEEEEGLARWIILCHAAPPLRTQRS